MYEQHFGLTGLPFCLNPAEWQFFESVSSAEVIPQIQHALSTASGVAIVTGPEGVGKTVLLHQLQALLARQGQAIVLPGTSLGTVDDLYVGIRRSLRTLDGSQVPGGCNRWEIVEHLRNSSEFWGPVAFLIDDAHLLTPGVFTELQFLLEQRSGPQTLCRLLLAGSLSLEETLAEPAMHGFAQRIRAFSFLTPLRLAESVEYLRSRMTHAGGELAKCFASDAVELIVEAADGSPRCLNLLADESMMLTYQQDEDQVTRATVVTALDHLKHLPHAWNVSVAPETDSSLNDSVERTNTWESSSDGVIEIGAPSSTPNTQHHFVADESESVVESGAPITDLPEEVEADDDFPTLEELQQESVGSEDVDETADPLSFDDADADFTGKTFEDGFRLAELKSVGTPTVEIDEDLDRRLLEAATNVATPPAKDNNDADEFACDALDGILPAYRRWIPAGTWVSQAMLQDELIRNWMPAERSSRPDESEVAEFPDSGGIDVYEVNIPAAEEPSPVWPPLTRDLGPGNPIPVSELDACTPPQETALDEAIGCDEIAASTPPTELPLELSRAEYDNDRRRWSDGQLLSSTAPHDNDDEHASADEDNEPSEDEVWLKIAELEDQSDDSEASDESTPKSDSKQLFTLPIALDDVTGECAPLADSVREIQRDLEDFQGADRGASLQTPIPGPLPRSPQSDSHRPPVTGTIVQSSSTAASDTETQLNPPQWISRTRQVVSVGNPAAQLRPAAGAESYQLTDDAPSTGPALSIPDWTAPAQEDALADETSQETPAADESPGFRNLFTRLRRNRT